MRFHGLDAILDWLAHLASMMAHWPSISCDHILGHGNGSVLIVDLIAVIVDYSSSPIPIKHLNPFRPRWGGGGGGGVGNWANVC